MEKMPVARVVGEKPQAVGGILLLEAQYCTARLLAESGATLRDRALAISEYLRRGVLNKEVGREMLSFRPGCHALWEMEKSRKTGHE